MHPLKRYLEAHDLSRESFARLVGTRPGYLAQLIGRHRFPSRALAEDISRATKGEVSAEDLLPRRPRVRRHNPRKSRS